MLSESASLECAYANDALPGKLKSFHSGKRPELSFKSGKKNQKLVIKRTVMWGSQCQIVSVNQDGSDPT